MASPTTPARLPGEPIPPPPEPRYPWKVGVAMVGLVALVVAVVWLAFQLLKGPSTVAEYPAAPTLTVYAQYFGATATVAEAAHRTAVAQQPATQQPVQATSAPVALPAPTAAPAATLEVATTVPAAAPKPATAAAPAVATSAPTPAATQVAAPLGPAEPVRTATVQVVGDSKPATPTPWPTVQPELAAQVSDAYTHYWQVRADVFLSLDTTPLAEVAAGQELMRLQKYVEDEQAAGHATQVKTQHSFVVLSANNNQAQVADDYRDLSIWVDPTTHEPLAGQSQPSSFDTAPEFKVIYDLQAIDGTWKVTDGVEVVGEGQTP